MEFRNILFAPGWYDNRIHRGIVKFASQRDWHLISDSVRGLSIPLGWRGDGIITSLAPQSDELRYFTKNLDLPIINLRLTSRKNRKFHHVILDNLAIGQMAAEYLLSIGFRNFMWISYSKGPQQRLRFRGYKQSINRAGFKCDEFYWEPMFSEQWEIQRKEMQKALAKAPKPLALFAYDDYLAANVVDACLRMDIQVPDEIAIMGTENNKLIVEALAVPLTSIDANLEELGYQAAKRLDRLIEHGPDDMRPWVIPPREIVPRKSTDIIAVNDACVAKAIQFIREHFATNIGVVDVVKASGVSRRVLETLFKNHLQRTINEEIIQARLSKVKDLLIHSELSIQKITLQTGFTRAAYLHRLFKKRFNATPKQFRESVFSGTSPLLSSHQ